MFVYEHVNNISRGRVPRCVRGEPLGCDGSRTKPQGSLVVFSKRVVSKKELKTVCGIPYSPQHIARLEAAGKFPKRIQLGPNRVAWLVSEVEKWVEERAAHRRA